MEGMVEFIDRKYGYNLDKHYFLWGKGTTEAGGRRHADSSHDPAMSFNWVWPLAPQEAEATAVA